MGYDNFIKSTFRDSKTVKLEGPKFDSCELESLLHHNFKLENLFLCQVTAGAPHGSKEQSDIRTILRLGIFGTFTPNFLTLRENDGGSPLDFRGPCYHVFSDFFRPKNDPNQSHVNLRPSIRSIKNHQTAIGSAVDVSLFIPSHVMKFLQLLKYQIFGRMKY